MGLPFLSLKSSVETKINYELDFTRNTTVLHQSTTSVLAAISHNLYFISCYKKAHLIKRKIKSNKVLAATEIPGEREGILFLVGWISHDILQRKELPVAWATKEVAGNGSKTKTKGGKCIFTYGAFPRLLLRCHESLNIQTEFESMNYAKTVSLRAAQCTLEFCLLR